MTDEPPDWLPSGGTPPTVALTSCEGSRQRSAVQRPPPRRSLVRRAAALGVAVLCVAPFHRLLSPDRNGPGGADALLRAEASWSVTLWGTFVVGLVGVAGALLARRRARAGSPPPNVVPVILSRLASVGSARMALTAAVVGAVLAAAVALGVYDRLLVGVDEMAQMIHARYLAAGRLGGALPAGAEAWAIPNMLVTGVGWTSQYPPGHPLVWAGFGLVGLGWMAGPLLFGLMVGLLSGAVDRLLPDAYRARGRIAVLLLAASPFALSLAGATPSHLTAGAAGALALYAALRGSENRGWSVLAGAAVGLMVLARPWTGLVLGPVLTLGVWVEHGGIPLARRALLPWILGGLPSALLLLFYDQTLFGSPFVLGYEALYGPAHGLGLHPDPWAYPYGLREALAYSSSDLVQLGAALLETPISVALLGAAYLVLARSLPRGVGVVAAWALVPVAANALYWFHAPRMLFEASPAWLLLAVLAVTHALERSGPVVRMGVGVATAATLLFAVPFGIARVASLRWNEETLSRIALPVESDGALVFVHASWDERIASMLQASGMRNDSIQPILRRNDTCALHQYAAARLVGARGASLPAIDLAQTAASPARARAASLVGGTRIWREPGHEWPEACVQEAVADRFGSLALAPLLWQGDLPGLESGRPMFVRDFGPTRNRAVISAFPDRRPLVYGYGDGSDERPTLLPYDEAMALLWGGAQPPS
jgi:hypothetical protein